MARAWRSPVRTARRRSSKECPRGSMSTSAFTSWRTRPQGGLAGDECPEWMSCGLFLTLRASPPACPATIPQIITFGGVRSHSGRTETPCHFRAPPPRMGRRWPEERATRGGLVGFLFGAALFSWCQPCAPLGDPVCRHCLWAHGPHVPIDRRAPVSFVLLPDRVHLDLELVVSFGAGSRPEGYYARCVAMPCHATLCCSTLLLGVPRWAMEMLGVGRIYVAHRHDLELLALQGLPGLAPRPRRIV